MDSEYKWEEIWQGDSYALASTRALKARKKLMEFKKHGIDLNRLGRVLELGCGSCDFIMELKRMGASISQYVGVDRSATALSRALTRTQEVSSFSLHNGDVSKLPVPDGFANTIISLGLIEHIGNVDELLVEVNRVAAPGCLVLISTSNVKSMMYLARRIREVFDKWPYGYQKNYSSKSIGEAISPYFEYIKMSAIHGDADFPLITSIDRVVGLVSSDWGRYILLSARKRRGGHE